MGNTNQSVSSNMSYGDRARQRRPSNAEALGPLEVPIGSKKYQDPSTTPPNSQAKFGKSLLDNLQTDVSSPQQLSAVEQQPYTRRYRAGSISISMQMPSPTPAPPPQLKKDKIPAVIKWDKGGKEIFVSGSFNNWETKIPLVKSESNFYTIIDLPEGEHHYKFLVDGQWKHNPDEPAMKSSKGSLHNTMKWLRKTLRY
ncbi:PRKAB2 [Bugula neritina]|uniref:5'-AMP-activated protein kinase subunit beta-1 n=1 Tax=Bugula neritina TaxID=10212 RepID=A0A7J7KTM8_BUGNE|nr:PRKAB2 [Bugula neritina]